MVPGYSEYYSYMEQVNQSVQQNYVESENLIHPRYLRAFAQVSLKQCYGISQIRRLFPGLRVELIF